MAARVEKELRDVLRSCRAELPDFPKVGHREVVEQALARKQPFDSHGKDGYRDVLLWHVVKELAAQGDVILVSNDKRAFAGPDDRLAPGLASEIAASGHRVELVASLRELTHRFAEQDLAELERVQKLVRQQSFRTLLDEALDEAIGAEFDLDARQIAELGYGVPIEMAWFSGPEELGRIVAVNAYSRPNGEALVELDITVGAHVKIQVANDNIARSLADVGDVWLDNWGMDWEDVRGANPVALATVRLVHLLAEASISVPEGRLNRLIATQIRLAPSDESFVRPESANDDEEEE